MSRKATSFDASLGLTMKEWRKHRKLTQDGLAAQLGLTFQQVQKYESGKNRLCAQRLVQLCNLLQVPIQNFVAQKMPEKEGE